MARRPRVTKEENDSPLNEINENNVPDEEESIYFNNSSIEYFPSGCTVLDCALGGGWAKNRFINIYGQSGSGKTLLLIEGTINYLRKYTNEHARYTETEAAFDENYAYHLGIPKDRFSLNTETYTIEDTYNDIMEFSKKNNGLYIVDSWDALSDEAELGREINEATMAMQKAKQISATFRRINSKISKSGITLMSVSQVRDNVGVTYGRKDKRSGGRALQFYGTQIVVIQEKEKIKKVIDKVTRVIGIISEIKVEKNKAGMPFRDCKVPIYFGYGIDDLEASLDWLDENVSDDSIFEELGVSRSGYGRHLSKWRAEGNPELTAKAAEIVKREWAKIEDNFSIGRTKYQ